MGSPDEYSAMENGTTIFFWDRPARTSPGPNLPGSNLPRPEIARDRGNTDPSPMQGSKRTPNPLQCKAANALMTGSSPTG